MIPVEIELKYRLPDAAAGARLIGADEVAGFVASGPIQTVEEVDRYLDTAARSLGAAGYACRLREIAGRTTLTLKGRAIDGTGPALRRPELEGPADPASPPARWPESAARDALLSIAGDRPLEELVALRQVRLKRTYALGDATVEMSVDDVTVEASGRPIERFAELEVELLHGDPGALEPLAAQLSVRDGLGPDATSKLERAMASLARAELQPPLASPAPSTPAAPSQTPVARARPRLAVRKTAGVLAEDHLAEAGRKVLRVHLAKMLAKEEGTRSGKDPEDLHDMRVATRRQRAAWRVFGDAFDAARTKRYRKRLRAVASDLGDVRDLDVLIEALEAYRDTQPEVDARALEPLIRAWHGRREAARTVLLDELDDDRYSRWLDGYVAFVQAEGLAARQVAPTEPHRVRDSMPTRIWAAYEQVRGYEPVMRWADVTTLHELRIAAKWLRYTLEFAQEPLGQAAAPLIARVVALQDHLGALHDADVAAGLAREFLVGHSGELSELEAAAIGRYLVDRERTLAHLRRTVGRPWRGVASLTFRRSLGRLLASL